ncbi:iap-1 [Cryptophlebia peltastica nucleopolyhedrovirus]|uniref:Iap-1 n=1 Tax=Cryptophlebia peltastica nucleopolyhedrovirus TaxID=2304025 RepID=A0A346RNV9_9ABAC|nr:iap-1 [Cryptophlebia peltastica nucleopolyhedrovirus]AXS67756.1 iap-1 [Cryptophlebia peltastica nucleopolyhedrovirus]
MDMCVKENRLKTFELWPVKFLSPELMAENGFYYLGRSDEVRCAFCKVEIMRWVENDDPALDHQKWAPQCPFVRKQVDGDGSSGGPDECVVSSSPSIPGPVHPRYATEHARLQTFKDWPISMKQKPHKLAEAGFYYTGLGDKTKCFFCNGGLKDWEDDDDPWEQHAKWYSDCRYVILVKGQDFIQRVHSEAAVVKNYVETTETVEEIIDDSKVCKICYNAPLNAAFNPCGHVVACIKCSVSVNKCPTCRMPFETIVKLYYS